MLRVDLDLIVAAVGELGEEDAGKLRELRPHAVVQLVAQSAQRPIQLVVQAVLGLALTNAPR